MTLTLTNKKHFFFCRNKGLFLVHIAYTIVSKRLCSPVVIIFKGPKVIEAPQPKSQPIAYNQHLNTRLKSSLQQAKRGLGSEAPAMKCFSPVVTQVTSAHIALARTCHRTLSNFKELRNHNSIYLEDKK